MTVAALKISKKVCLLGDMSVGKTSLVRRYVEDRFGDKYLSTLGVKISRKALNLDLDIGPTEVNLLIWDIAGGTDNIELTLKASYLRGASAALFVCDLTRAETLLNFELYMQRMRLVSPNAKLFIAANKFDLLTAREVEMDSLEQIAGAIGATEIRLTSAKTGQGIEDLFAVIAREILPQEAKE